MTTSATTKAPGAIPNSWKDRLLVKRYETTEGGYVYVEFKLKFKFLFWAYVSQRRLQRSDTWEIESLPWDNYFILLSGVGWFSLEFI